MSEQRRGGSILPWALMALGVVAVLGLWLIPVLDCPACAEWNFFGSEKWDLNKLESLIDCQICGNRGKVPVLKKWLYRLRQ